MSVSLLATYGTLRRTFGQLEELGIERHLTFCSRCRFKGEMYDLGAYPGAVPGSDVLHGELFRLEASGGWKSLDEYEGYLPEREAASLFVRREVALQQPSSTRAWVYWYNRDPTGHSRIPSGDWVAYTKRD